MKTRHFSSPFALVAAAALVYAPSAFAQSAPAPSAPPAAANPARASSSLLAAPADQPTDQQGAPGASDAPQGVEGPRVELGGPSAEAVVRDSTSDQLTEDEKKESKLPFRGSTFFFDQSMTTQTAQIAPSSQLSYVPLYEWWLSFRPRWYFTDHILASGRFDYTKEFTNSQNTDNYREDVFGDVWLNLVYDSAKALGKNTKVTAGIRAILPTSKESQANGYYVQGGVTASIRQKVPLNGDSAKFFNSLSVSLSEWYNHPFSRATTPTNESLDYTRQDTDGRSFVSDQVRGATLTNHKLVSALGVDLSITPKFSFGVSGILISNWHYPLPDSGQIEATGTTINVPTNGNAPLYTADTWFIANFDYDVIDELSIGLGYYSLANALAPDGTRRGLFSSNNIWWSPDARIFLTFTANLDKIYEDASGRKTGLKNAKSTSSSLPFSF